MRDALYDLRQDEPEEQADQDQHQKDRNDDRKDVTELRFLDLLKYFVLEKYDDEVDQICDNDTDDDRRHELYYTGKPGENDRQVGQDQVCDDTCHGCHGIGAPSMADCFSEFIQFLISYIQSQLLYYKTYQTRNKYGCFIGIV